MNAVRTALVSPARIVAGGFIAAIAVGTAALKLPFASVPDASPTWIDALFTATSAVTVTGLNVTDTATTFTPIGEGIILVLIQVGGLGTMVIATLVALLLFGRIGLVTRHAVATESKTLSLADVRAVVLRILLFSLSVEFLITILLSVRIHAVQTVSWPEALYSGLFHGVSAFNNAGFSLYEDGLVGFVGDPWFLLTISAAVILGGLGFPVVFELMRRARHPRQWSALTRITLVLSFALLILGTLFYWYIEGSNPATLGGVSPAQTPISAFAASTMTRTAGFAVFDMGQARSETLFLTDIWMFIGGGSAGTAGGVKVTTIGILAFLVWSEIRGGVDVVIGHRRIASQTQRQAIAIVVLSLTALVAGVVILMAETTFAFQDVLFEATSAFGTVGLSTGITPDLPESGQVIIMLLMIAGRVGPLTLAVALAGRRRMRRLRAPEETMIVG